MASKPRKTTSKQKPYGMNMCTSEYRTASENVFLSGRLQTEP